MGEDKGESGGPVEPEQGSAGGEPDWAWVVAVKVARKDGCDQAGWQSAGDQGVGEEEGESKGTLSVGLRVLADVGTISEPAGEPEGGGWGGTLGLCFGSLTSEMSGRGGR